MGEGQAMSAPCEETVVAARGLASGSYLATRRAKRGDTLIASVVLVLLLAGWLMNFVGPRQLTEGVGSFIAHKLQRQA
jgi:hypothetical protein